MHKIAITGDGFISAPLALACANFAEVHIITGDIRKKETFNEIDHTFDHFFHFAAPSSQMFFKRNMRYSIESTIQGFLNVTSVCEANGVRLIYPSTGLLSQGKENEYARCKKICEDIALSSSADTLGLRIFAGYGPQEKHKDYYASVPYLFARDFKNGINPVVFGDGTQSRDFIYIDDLVSAIMVLGEKCLDLRIVDVGSGKKTSFNDIIDMLGSVSGDKILPKYIEKPNNYVEETLASTKVMEKYNCIPEITMLEGIKKIWSCL